MNGKNRRGIFSLTLLCILILMPISLLGQTARVSPVPTMQNTEEALRQAEAVGAPLYAKALYQEAHNRLNVGKSLAATEKKAERQEATLALVQGYHAARAAKAQALWNSTFREVRNLREDITRMGGKLEPMTLDAIEGDVVARGADSRERVVYAQQRHDMARTVGGEAFDAGGLVTAQENLNTAKLISKGTKESATADHLSYVAEMLARRAEYMARKDSMDRLLPSLRMERTRQAEVSAARTLEEERKQRMDAERQAEELRRQLEAEVASRRTQQAELDRLRNQITVREQQIRQQLSGDRLERERAEAQLSNLRAEYERALAAAPNHYEVEQLRRQVEDQSIALRSLVEQEKLSEQALTSEVQRLREQLERERQSGAVGVQALTERENALQSQQAELQNMIRAREEIERQRLLQENRHQAAISEAQQRLLQSERESNALRGQVETEKRKAEEAQAELARVTQELEAKDREARERVERMETALAEIAETRREDRGFVVTLPGMMFDSGRSNVKPGARSTLSRISDQLRNLDQWTLLVEGHTDSQGPEQANQKLSEQRAQAVKDHLALQGLSGDRIAIVGKGEASPVASNDDAAGRQQNRRVELIIQRPAVP